MTAASAAAADAAMITLSDSSDNTRAFTNNVFLCVYDNRSLFYFGLFLIFADTIVSNLQMYQLSIFFVLLLLLPSFVCLFVCFLVI